VLDRLRCPRPTSRARRWLALPAALAVGFAGVAVLDGQTGGRGSERAAASRIRSEPEPAAPEPAAPTPTTSPVVAPPAAVPVVAPPPAAVPEPGVPPATPPPRRAEAAQPPKPVATPPPPVPALIVSPSGPLDPSAPVHVEVPAVGVAAPVDPLGLNPDGTLEVPTRFARAGWYTGRPTPGETGPAVVVAHRSGKRGPGAFWHLPRVKPGDEIVITRTDGRRVVFAVDRVEQHQKSAFPTDAVYGPIAEAGLRLITCGGPFEPALGDHYRDNVIVFARMTGVAV
jgi:hypothetical protein